MPRYSNQVYYGLRLGVGFATVHSDDQYLNGGSAKAGLDVGAVVGVQLGYHSPVYFETGLSNISHDYFDTSHTGTLFATVGVNF